MIACPELEIKTWIKILSFWPASDDDATKQQQVLSLIASRLDGYAAVTDAPAANLVTELLELYLDVVVVCTVRDPVAWEKSMESIISALTMQFLRYMLLPLPVMRFYFDYINLLRDAWFRLYGGTELPIRVTTRITYNAHIAWLQRVVTEEKLVFFDVREGWEPLCKALGKDVPEGVGLPRITDAEAIERFAKEQVKRGLVRRAAILVGVVASVGDIVMMY